VVLAIAIWGIHALEHLEILRVFPALVNQLALGDLLPFALGVAGVTVLSTGRDGPLRFAPISPLSSH
jgi:hypothetical protein